MGWAESSDSVPIYPGWVEFIGGDDTAQWAIIRHGTYINMLFMDYTVKKVRLKELWTLNWHRLANQEMDQAPPEFPPWMEND
jgi:hypothetical protein